MAASDTSHDAVAEHSDLCHATHIGMHMLHFYYRIGIVGLWFRGVSCLGPSISPATQRAEMKTLPSSELSSTRLRERDPQGDQAPRGARLFHLVLKATEYPAHEAPPACRFPANAGQDRTRRMI